MLRLTDRAIALIVKHSYLEDEKVHKVSGHSLRAGFVTTTAKKRVPEHLIMKQTGHKCSDTLKRYIRIGTRFDENAASLIGL
jgi:integrase